MSQYVQSSVLEQFGQEVDSLPQVGQDIVLQAASRIFDKLCGVPDNFFAKAGASATDQTFYGDGTAFLKLPPFIGTPTVAIPGSEYTPEDYTVVNGSLVILGRTTRRNLNEYERNDRFTGWYDAVPITVTARWGWTAIPDDVQFAVMQIAINMWRQGDPAFTSISQSGEPNTLPAVPAVAQTIADLYRAKFGLSAVFA